MRLAPVILAYAQEPHLALDYTAQNSRTTHAAAAAVDAYRYFARLLIGALKGRPKHQFLATDFWCGDPLNPEIASVLRGSFKDREPPEIRGSGYVVKSLEAALWSFCTTDTFAAGALKAVNLGDDADTTGAIYGQLAGAYYGVCNIPESWRKKLAMRETSEAFAFKLLTMADGEQSISDDG